MKWNKIWPCDWAYVTSLPVSECVSRLCSEPHIFGKEWLCEGFFYWRDDHFTYDCYEIAEDRSFLRFTGMKSNGNQRRTEYIVNLFQLPLATRIELLFQHEKWGRPPLTSTRELDVFMKEKIDASRVSLRSIRPGDGSFSWKQEDV